MREWARVRGRRGWRRGRGAREGARGEVRQGEVRQGEEVVLGWGEVQGGGGADGANPREGGANPRGGVGRGQGGPGQTVRDDRTPSEMNQHGSGGGIFAAICRMAHDILRTWGGIKRGGMGLRRDEVEKGGDEVGEAG